MSEKKAKRPRQWNSTLPLPEKRLSSSKGLSRASSRSSGTKTGMPRLESVKPRNAKRRASEFVRCYHSMERVLFVKSLPCAASGLLGADVRAIDNAHVTDDGSKGAGRKSGYRCIAPLLAKLHRMLHDQPEKFRALYPDFDAERAAAETEAAWLAARSQGGDSR